MLMRCKWNAYRARSCVRVVVGRVCVCVRGEHLNLDLIAFFLGRLRRPDSFYAPFRLSVHLALHVSDRWRDVALLPRGACPTNGDSIIIYQGEKNE